MRCYSGTNFIGWFYWLLCDFQISKRPGHTHINHRAIFSQSYDEHIYSVLSCSIYSATYLLRFSPKAWMNTSFHGIDSHLGQLPSGGLQGDGWITCMCVLVVLPPALFVSCQPGVSTGSDVVRLPCKSLCTFNYWTQGPINGNIIFVTIGNYWQIIFFSLGSLWPKFNGTLLKGD